MKQRARRKITVLKKKAIHENRRRGTNIDRLVKDEMSSEMEDVIVETPENRVVLMGATVEEEKNSLPTFIVQNDEREKKKKPKGVRESC